MRPVFSIFLGNHKTIYLKVVNSNCQEQGPVDLAACTEIDIALPNQDGTFTHLLLSEEDVVITPPANLGKFSAEISGEVSAALNVGELQNLNVTFTIAAEEITVTFEKSFSVFDT